ncbi:MAG: helix-turn-helix transcriptional regulator [Paludibacteraceae bacterium]|nr:helix-turn-helix transcriptional regulator [Paludibacteraceae bacterium]
MKQIGETIKQRRRQLGITQQTLAMLAGVGINTIVSIERGSNSASLATLMKLTDCLGLEIKLDVRGTAAL